MRIEGNLQPKSSFLSMEKDASLISNMLLRNERLKKLLYYTTPDCLDKKILTEDQSLELFGKNIKLVPKLYVDNSVLNYMTNPKFRDNVIEFDIICHFDQWQLKDFQLRPYRIAAEIDSMFDEKHLSGIGHLHFLGANQIILTDEYAGLCLMYQAIHGGEDKTKMLNPNDEKQFEQDYRKMMGV